MYLWGELNVYSMVLKTRESVTVCGEVQLTRVLCEEVKMKKKTLPWTLSLQEVSFTTLWLTSWTIFLNPKNNVLPRWLSGKESACDAGDAGSIPGWGRSPGGKHNNPFQYSCLENLMDWGAWQATVHRVAKSQTWLKWLSIHTSRMMKFWKWPTSERLIFRTASTIC